MRGFDIISYSDINNRLKNHIIMLSLISRATLREKIGPTSLIRNIKNWLKLVQLYNNEINFKTYSPFLVI